ncbi:MAG: hypothetical protein ACRCWQ_10825 [Bacilli bacterium]
MTDIKVLGEKLGKDKVVQLSMILDRENDHDDKLVAAIIEPYGASDEDLDIIRSHLKSRVRHRKQTIVVKKPVVKKEKVVSAPKKTQRYEEATGTMADMLRNLYATK